MLQCISQMFHLPRRCFQFHYCVLLAAGVDLRAQPSSGAFEGLVLPDFFLAPALC